MHHMLLSTLYDDEPIFHKMASIDTNETTPQTYGTYASDKFRVLFNSEKITKTENLAPYVSRYSSIGLTLWDPTTQTQTYILAEKNQDALDSEDIFDKKPEEKTSWTLIKSFNIHDGVKTDFDGLDILLEKTKFLFM